MSIVRGFERRPIARPDQGKFFGLDYLSILKQKCSLFIELFHKGTDPPILFELWSQMCNFDFAQHWDSEGDQGSLHCHQEHLQKHAHQVMMVLMMIFMKI